MGPGGGSKAARGTVSRPGSRSDRCVGSPADLRPAADSSVCRAPRRSWQRLRRNPDGTSKARVATVIGSMGPASKTPAPAAEPSEGRDLVMKRGAVFPKMVDRTSPGRTVPLEKVSPGRHPFPMTGPGSWQACGEIPRPRIRIPPTRLSALPAGCAHERHAVELLHIQGLAPTLRDAATEPWDTAPQWHRSDLADQGSGHRPFCEQATGPLPAASRCGLSPSEIPDTIPMPEPPRFFAVSRVAREHESASRQLHAQCLPVHFTCLVAKRRGAIPAG